MEPIYARLFPAVPEDPARQIYATLHARLQPHDDPRTWQMKKLAVDVFDFGQLAEAIGDWPALSQFGTPQFREDESDFFGTDDVDHAWAHYSAIARAALTGNDTTSQPVAESETTQASSRAEPTASDASAVRQPTLAQPPGWYPDPWAPDTGILRWWTGEAWSADTHPPTR